ncbi:dicarboxylate/amino acid:cation symporter [Alkanindiges sp. WGS2144]|uniref:dicarboxylate/amino acid:cation symporter n=1 Tax=Alkanindiges sp. WGS2144 TaxID=3366808 RepID=UPI003751EC8A
MAFIKTLNGQILLAAVLGILFGLFLNHLPAQSGFYGASLYALGIASSIFIGLLKLILIPLIFTSIVVGISSLQAHAQIHRVWKITAICVLSTTAIAVTIGIMAAHLFEPGKDLNIALFQEAMAGFEAKQQFTPTEFIGQFINGVLVNPFAAMSTNNVLAVVLFAVLIGAALVAGGKRYETINTFLNQAFQLIMHIVGWIMLLAPIGIFALLAKLIVSENLAVLGSLAQFAAVVTGTTIFHGVVILPVLLWIFGRMSPLKFFRGARPALITAFATSSSSATMPVSMQCARENLGVHQNIAGFVVPLGSQVNMDGTALYEAAAALFVANLVGLDLSIGQQVVVCLTAMIASMGAPGIPSAGMVTMIMVLQSVGLPAEAVAILLPIDRILDTVRTVVNVQGDIMISVVVQKWTGTTSDSADLNSST